MKRVLKTALAVLPLFVCVQLGIAQTVTGKRIVISPAMCAIGGNCTSQLGSSCVDSNGDGTCDWTEIPWEPV